MRGWRTLIVGVALVGGIGFGYRQLLPVFRVDAQSELVMFGDLNGDRR